MGQKGAEETGALSDASDTMQRAWMEAEADESRVFCTDRHPTGRTFGGTARTAEGIKESDSHLFPQFGTVGMGG